MTTLIEDNELDSELQELYSIGRLWVTDLELLAQDLTFLQKYLDKVLIQAIKQPHISNRDCTLMAEYLVRVGMLDTLRIELKESISNYMHIIEALIDKTTLSFPLSLVETQSLLEREINSLLRSYVSLKRDVLGKELLVPGADSAIRQQVYNHF